jgi:hypothetical protein
VPSAPPETPLDELLAAMQRDAGLVVLLCGIAGSGKMALMSRHRPTSLRSTSSVEAQIELDAVELAKLDEAIAEADPSKSVSSAVVLAELARIARAAR